LEKTISDCKAQLTLKVCLLVRSKQTTYCRNQTSSYQVNHGKNKEERNWTNNTFNKHLNHLKAILLLIQWDIIESNPAHKINNLEVSESNNPASIQEIEIIKTELETKHLEFYSFNNYFHGIRPEEILKNQVGNG
jgi:hypothetical protein